ncbi:VOC family protein [Methyloglobulus sp.]|uniref:VOC family protein n=1 Tax=Methyloglobulus sp. TaxID=2518622 RepID=UPI0032B75D08
MTGAPLSFTLGEAENILHISPHLCFNGQCRTAFEHYQRIFGGHITTMLTYGESPMASQVDPELYGHIVHATLQLGDIELTGVDQLPCDYGKPQGFFVTLTIDGAARAKEIFTALAENGEIRFAFQQTFWSPGFGVLTDQFFVPWEINSVESPISA